MKTRPTRLENTVRMRLWRERKGGLSPPSKPASPSVLEHWVDEWREWMEELGVCRGTVVTQIGHVRRFVRWCATQGVQDPKWISTGLIQNWLTSLESRITRWGTPLTCSTVDGQVGCTRRFLGFLSEQRAIPWNPLANRSSRKRTSRPLPVVLDEETISRLLEAPDTSDPVGVRDRAILELFYSTGIRRCELASLRVNDLRLETRIILVARGKGGKMRMVPIGPPARRWLLHYLHSSRELLLASPGDSEVLFLTGYGEGCGIL